MIKKTCLTFWDKQDCPAEVRIHSFLPSKSQKPVPHYHAPASVSAQQCLSPSTIHGCTFVQKAPSDGWIMTFDLDWVQWGLQASGFSQSLLDESSWWFPTLLGLSCSWKAFPRHKHLNVYEKNLLLLNQREGRRNISQDWRLVEEESFINFPLKIFN